MLELRDGGTDQAIRLGAGDGVRVRVAATRHGALTGLRARLVADALYRVCDLMGGHVVLGAPSDVPLCAELGVRPPATTPEELAERADVHIGTTDGPGIHLRVAELTFDGQGDPPDVAAHGVDPLALRLAILAVPRAEPRDLTTRGLLEADAELRHWRGRVAAWAERQSRPVHAEVVRAPLESDLDLPGTLDALRGVENDPELAEGAKFETFVYTDRVLALELPRDVGRA